MQSVTKQSPHVYTITTSDGRQHPALRLEYATQDDAAEAVQMVMGWPDIVLSDDYQHSDRQTAVSCYETQEECDADQTGAFAPRIIATPSTPSYCTQNDGDCSTCSLKNYGRDCQNNPVSLPPLYALNLDDMPGPLGAPNVATSSTDFELEPTIVLDEPHAFAILAAAGIEASEVFIARHAERVVIRYRTVEVES